MRKTRLNGSCAGVNARVAFNASQYSKILRQNVLYLYLKIETYGVNAMQTKYSYACINSHNVVCVCIIHKKTAIYIDIVHEYV